MMAPIYKCQCAACTVDHSAMYMYIQFSYTNTTYRKFLLQKQSTWNVLILPLLLLTETNVIYIYMYIYLYITLQTHG